ncbi:MAG: hypothetical protein ACR2H3_08475 [Acidimicrobiales bacterium]
MLLILAVPAVIALLPIATRTLRSTLVAAVALTVAALLGLASIGIFFLPTVGLAWVAAGAASSRTRNRSPHRSAAP